MFNDLQKLASTLDEHIEKGQKLEKKSRIEVYEEQIAKGLSHDPFMPHEMSYDSPYYNPYRLVPGEGFLPYPAEYWESQGKNKEDYRLTSELYQRIAPVQKALDGLFGLGRLLEKDLEKGGAVPIGTIHTYADGQRYKKVQEGVWTPVAGLEDKSHAKWLQHKDPKVRQKASGMIEEHAGKADKVKQLIEQRTREQKHGDEIKRQTMKEAIGHVRTAMSKLYDGDVPEGMEDHFKKVEDQAGIPSELQRKIGKRGKGQGREIKLSKDELQTLLKSGKYALISAGRNPAHEEDVKLGDDKIQERYDSLKNELVEGGYAFSNVKGHYGGQEDSFLVMVHEADKEYIKKLGTKFNQDSIIYSEKGKHEMHFTTGEKKGKHHKGEGLDPKAEGAEDYYSEAETADGEKVKFALNFDFAKEYGEGGAEKVDPKKNLKEIGDTLSGSKKHHVTVDFTHGGQKYSHKFENVSATTHSEATDKVHAALRSKLPGAQVSRVKVEQQRSPKGAEAQGEV
jgi:hypothetical protein